jgi:capsid portal protein
VGPPDTILEEDHPLTILSKFGSTNLCSAVTLSYQDGRHSAVALLLKAALIQVSDYRLLGASGFNKKGISNTHNLTLSALSCGNYLIKSVNSYLPRYFVQQFKTM